MIFLNKLKSLSNLRSATDKKIANFILNNASLVKSLSSLELAKEIGVSQSTIIKFSKKVGANSYTEFKISIGEDLVKSQQIQLHNDIQTDDNILTIANKLFKEKQTALQETYQINSVVTIENVIKLINKANKVLIVGLGNSALVAKDFAYKLNKISVTTLTEMDSHAQLVLTQTLGKNDLLFVISYSGKKKEILTAAELARDKKIPIVSLTSLSYNKLHELSDYLLYSVADESIHRSSSISSRTAQHAITDLLFMGVVQQNQYRSLKLINESQRLVDKLSDK